MKREPNFKVGWLVPNKVLALTHYHPEILPEDVAGVMQQSQELMEALTDPVNLVIDNRVAPMPQLYPLAQLFQMSPLFQNELLRWVIVVKPKHLEVVANELPIEQVEHVSLKNVDEVEEALVFLKEQVMDADWSQLDVNFFP